MDKLTIELIMNFDANNEYDWLIDNCWFVDWLVDLYVKYIYSTCIYVQ